MKGKKKGGVAITFSLLRYEAKRSEGKNGLPQNGGALGGCGGGARSEKKGCVPGGWLALDGGARFGHESKRGEVGRAIGARVGGGVG